MEIAATYLSAVDSANEWTQQGTNGFLGRQTIGDRG